MKRLPLTIVLKRWRQLFLSFGNHEKKKSTSYHIAMPFSKSTRRNAFPPLACHPPWWGISCSYKTLTFGLKNRNHGCLTMSIYYFRCYFCSQKDSEFLSGTMLSSCVVELNSENLQRWGTKNQKRRFGKSNKCFILC